MPDIFKAPAREPKTEVIAKKIEEPPAPETKPNFPGLFSAYMRYPHGIAFTHQEQDEEIILFARRSFFTNLPWISIALFGIFIPPLFYLYLISFNVPFISLETPAAVIIILLYYFLLIGFAFYSYIDWFYNIGIITQKRLLDIDFMHLSYIDIAIAQLVEIEDVVHRQKGFFASFFDYGDVIAHTVSSREDFVFEKIPHPAKVVNILSKMLTRKR